MTMRLKNWIRSAVLAAAVAGVSLPCGSFAQEADKQAEKQAVKQADLPVEVVVLYSSGVGYFEHAGSVKDDASAELRFKTKQINDVLKSLVLQDLGGGRVSTVVYPSQEPIGRLLASFQVNLSANPSLAELLNQLRGARVSVQLSTETIKATVLGVEKKSRPVADNKGVVETWSLNLFSGGFLRSVPLDEVRQLQLEDEQLQREMEKALGALAQARDQDTKPVSLNFSGKGDRRVRLGYVVEAPVWKTSYRLVLSANEAKESKAKQEGKLQGWAIIENQTDNDWNNVSLSLVSGRPISFIQELYTPLYVPRPVVQPELFASLRPQTYDGGMDYFAKKVADAPMPGQAPAATAAELRRNRAVTAGGRGGGGGRADLADLAAVAESSEREALDATSSIISAASAAKLGELFQYTVGNISLPRQRSAMVPIITDPIEVERLSIYNQGTLAKHPLNGAKLKNTTGKHLLQGPITVLAEGAYAGDARVDNVPPGQERLISFGIDLNVLVDPDEQGETNTIQSGRIVKGVLHLKRRLVHGQKYKFANKSEDDAKALIVEHPRRDQWELTPESPKPIETTPQLYRFRIDVPAGQNQTLQVQQAHVTGEAVAILPMDLGSLDYYLQTGSISPKVREAMGKAAILKRSMVDQQRRLEVVRQQVNTITQDQSRIRENIKAAPDKSQLQTRLLEKLTQQESQLEQLFKQQDDAQRSLEKAQKDLEDYLANLDVE